MQFPTERLAQVLFMSVSMMALILCPHSKVEESFNLQATHDLFYYGITPLFGGKPDLHYDHLQYPGVVPRSFLGSLLLSTACRVCSLISLPLHHLDPLQVQFLARFLLLAATWHAWFRFAAAVRIAKQPSRSIVPTYLWLISACQFHVPFYASRMLPNTFATIVVLHGYAYWLQGKFSPAAACLVAATTLFRCDVILLVFTVGLTWLVRKELTVQKCLQVGIQTAVLCLLATVPIDSSLWRYWVWPEGQVFYYNTILGKSSDWGTLPWHWYVTRALPKIMLGTGVLVPLAVVRWSSGRAVRQLLTWEVDYSWMPYFLPALGYVGLYSFLGHKEVRFLFPIVPLLNLAAAVGMSKLHQAAFVTQKGKSSSQLAKVAFFGGLGCLVVSLAGSMLFLQVSRHNYPGGKALTVLADHLVHHDKGVIAHVWIDVATAMSGVSLFGQQAAAIRTPMTIDKAGYEPKEVHYEQFSHLISEDPEIDSHFHVFDVIQGKPRLDIFQREIVTEDTLFLLERNDWHY